MKVDLMYSVHYIPHPWDQEMNKAGRYVYALCREVRLPVAIGAVRGRPVSWEPVAVFETTSEGTLFDQFLLESKIPTGEIEPSQQLLEAKGIRLPRRES